MAGTHPTASTPGPHKEEVLRLAGDRGVGFILLQFLDILGVVKSVAIPVQRLEKALDGQILLTVHRFMDS